MTADPDRSGQDAGAPEIDVFVIRTTEGIDRAGALLSPGEIRKAASFKSIADQIRFAVSHAALRSILSRKLGIAPRDIVISTGPNGKPSVCGLKFNLTKSGDIALVATGRVPLGIDIERIVPLDVMQVARHHFSTAERRSLVGLGHAEMLTAFFEIWTGKEAFLKATGDGLSRRLDQFDVSVGANAAILSTRPDSAEAYDWRLWRLDVRAGYAAALCTKGNSRAKVTVQPFDL